MPVRHAILGLLHERPRHGYDLRTAFQALVGGSAVWDLKPAQVYTTLARLERDHLIEPIETVRIGGPDRTIFRLTDDGRTALADWFSSGMHGEHVRDGFFVKLMVAIAAPEAEPRDVLRVQRATLYRDLHAVTSHRARIDRTTDLARAMLLDKAVMHLEADVRWLDMVEARLGEIERQPVPIPTPARRGRPPGRSVEARDGDPPMDLAAEAERAAG
ncbi:MAG TPA: PadR family transcriptional regulator [Coriobacteriia bacterium]|nr:PadR family transcriptional regulator [Coriobacteriia bacterium]